jgi:hypothetical protein
MHKLSPTAAEEARRRAPRVQERQRDVVGDPVPEVRAERHRLERRLLRQVDVERGAHHAVALGHGELLVGDLGRRRASQRSDSDDRERE